MNTKKLRKISLGLFGAVTLVLTGCASGPRVQEVEVEDPQFKVMEASYGGREEWIDFPNSYAKKVGEDEGYDIKKYYYYTGDSKSASKRMACEKASANVTDDISRQIAVFVDSSIAKATDEYSSESSDGNTVAGEVSQETEQITSQLSKAALHGVIQRKKYWEKRDYSQAGGPRSIYYCWILNQVERESVDKMITRASTMRLRSDKDLKAKVGNKLSNISSEYEKYMLSH